MKQTSRMTIGQKRARKRGDHPAGCRISTEERARLHIEIAELERGSGIKLSLGSYTKHALLNYARLRAIESRLNNWLRGGGPRSDSKSLDLDEVRAIMGRSP